MDILFAQGSPACNAGFGIEKNAHTQRHWRATRKKHISHIIFLSLSVTLSITLSLSLS